MAGLAPQTHYIQRQMVTENKENAEWQIRLKHSNILTYIQQDAMLHSLIYLETALHVSGGTTTHHQKDKQLYLQHLVFVTTLLLTAAIVLCSTPPTAHSNQFQLFHDRGR
jgi:hypothetical protein